jgi:hypothetical protein
VELSVKSFCAVFVLLSMKKAVTLILPISLDSVNARMS